MIVIFKIGLQNSFKCVLMHFLPLPSYLSESLTAPLLIHNCALKLDISAKSDSLSLL